MKTDVDFNLDAQRAWIKACFGKPHYYHWLINADEKPIGLLYISDLNLFTRTSSWGFYIGDDDAVGYGAFVPPLLYNFLFGILNIGSVRAEVFYDNVGVIGLHKLHGYKFEPNDDRVILKQGREILLVGMRLSSEDWSNNHRFHRPMVEFPTSTWFTKPEVLR